MLLAAVDFDNLHQVLRVLYDEMMPLCGNMTGVAKGIAGLGALFYVAAKVWQSLARAEPIDVYPLLRPFAIGLCILFFPTFVMFGLSLFITICAPTVGIYLGAKQSAKIPQLLQDLTNQFKIDYVCPKCGTFLGEIPWESLRNRKQCPMPSCKAKWVSE